jgi:hypothetical protein
MSKCSRCNGKKEFDQIVCSSCFEQITKRAKEEGRKQGALDELRSLLKYFFELRDNGTNAPAVHIYHRIEERILLLQSSTEGVSSVKSKMEKGLR